MVKEDKYEYHKQNDYPGERVAEKKRVADREDAADKKSNARVAEKGRTDELKADSRVARKGRMDEEMMDSQIAKDKSKAKEVNSERNASDATGLVIFASIVVILVAGLVWSFVIIGQQGADINSLQSQISTPAQQQPGVTQTTTTQQNPAVTTTTTPTQTDYQTAQTVAKNYVMQTQTYSYDGSNLALNESITLSPQDCGGVICYQFVYQFVSSHAGYGDRTGQNLPIDMTSHQVVVTVRNDVVFDAYIDHTWNILTQQLLVPAP